MDLVVVKDVSVLMNAIGAGNCLVLSYAYLTKREHRTQRINPVLSLLFFILGAVILNTIFNFGGYSFYLWAFEPLTNALCFAIAPLLYLYARSLGRNSAGNGLWSRHLLPFYLYFSLTALMLLFPKSPLGKWAMELVESQGAMVLWNLHFGGYILPITREFRKLGKTIGLTPKIIVWGTVSIWFFNLVFYVYRIWIEPLPNLVYLNITLLFSAMTLYLFYRKMGMVDRDRGKGKRAIKTKVTSGPDGSIDPVINAIQEYKYYRNPELDIRGLSVELQIPYHELSSKINQEYHQNFNAFINSFRVQEVARALETQEHESYTIMGLAQKAGFKSPSAFYAAFKKEKGTTPTAFLKSAT